MPLPRKQRAGSFQRLGLLGPLGSLSSTGPYRLNKLNRLNGLNRLLTADGLSGKNLHDIASRVLGGEILAVPAHIDDIVDVDTFLD